jgi:hypothetical protein
VKTLVTRPSAHQDVVSVRQVLERIGDQDHCLAAQGALDALLKQGTTHVGVNCNEMAEATHQKVS